MLNMYMFIRRYKLKILTNLWVNIYYNLGCIHFAYCPDAPIMGYDDDFNPCKVHVMKVCGGTYMSRDDVEGDDYTYFIVNMANKFGILDLNLLRICNPFSKSNSTMWEISYLMDDSLSTSIESYKKTIIKMKNNTQDDIPIIGGMVVFSSTP